MLRFLRLLLRGVAALAVLLVLTALGFAAWFTLRSATYTQREDAGALERKAAELAWMKQRADAKAPRPNLVLILFDDLGYADLSAYDALAPPTPRIDALAREGALFESFYAPAPYCTPSRAGFLTGRWPIRTTLTHILFPRGHAIQHLHRTNRRSTRLPADEILLPEALKAAGYATAMVGKWHLGDEAPSLPNDFGFDHYFGVLHSNDMSPLPLWRNREVAESDPVDQRFLTPRYTDDAIAWIEQQKGPFFLHFAHNFPHVPLHATPDQAGKSDAGLYGDVIADLDASVGKLVDALARTGHAQDTLVLITSDNGPWYEGNPGNARGRKNDSFEGGMRVPFIAWWPGRIAPQRIAAPAAGIDVLPTALALAGVPLPRDRAIDGRDLTGALLGGAAPPDAPIFYYSDRALEAVRLGPWKLHTRHGVYGGGAWSFPLVPRVPQGPWLFDLRRDPGESYDVHAKHPDDFGRLDALRAKWEREVEANPRGWTR